MRKNRSPFRDAKVLMENWREKDPDNYLTRLGKLEKRRYRIISFIMSGKSGREVGQIFEISGERACQIFVEVAKV
ncbi:MAG TPA: hypothetical protein P5274_00285, partial [Candidatus Paceibacterota bacterium]|nr:hypothetical protein [Candidatus Paceibacterota bacterium]